MYHFKHIIYDAEFMTLLYNSVVTKELKMKSDFRNFTSYYCNNLSMAP